MRREMHHVGVLVILCCFHTSHVAGDESCSAAPSSTTFTHERALLTVQAAAAPTNAVVPIRGRGADAPFLHVVYGNWSEMPDSIGPPESAAFPLVAQASHSGGELPPVADYAVAAADLLSSKLTSHGAVLLRGLPLSEICREHPFPDVRCSAAYSAFIEALEVRIGWQAVKSAGGGTIRKDIQHNVRTASEEPCEHTIEPHMDMAHTAAHPKKIAFFCAAGPPAGVGGETVLTNMRGVSASLQALGLPEEFAAHGGVAYRKRLWSTEHVSHSFTWQQFFFTDHLSGALEAVRKRDPNAKVIDDATDVIEFEETLAAVHSHPTTGEALWFNGVHTNHKSYYEEALHIDTSDGSPMHTAYADGEEIPETT